MASSGDGTGWDGTVPANTEPVYKGALEIRDLRLGVGIRNDKEHIDAAASSAGGEHMQGSGRFYSLATGSIPNTQPDATALVAADNGMGWHDSTTGWLYILTDYAAPTIGNGWTSIGAMLGMTWSASGTDPTVVQTNTTQEDTDEGRETLYTWNGEQSGGESSSLATMKICHVGTGDDEKGQIILSVNGLDGLLEVCRLEALDGSDQVQLLMNAKKISGLADGTNATDALAAGQVDDTTIQLDGSDQLETINYGVYARYSNTQVANTAGGTATKDAWRKCALNTEDVDASSIASIATNTITIATTGVYRFKGDAVFRSTALTRIRIRKTNATAATIAISGNSYMQTTSNNDHELTCSGKFAATANDTIELQYYCVDNGTQGTAMNIGAETEVYAHLEIIGTVAG